MMTNNIFVSMGLSRGAKTRSSTALFPGGWGDRIVFGYMFRVISAVAAVIFPACLVLVWAFFNHWQMTNGMLIFFGGMVALTITIGEAMRVGVYESRISGTSRAKSIDEYTEITPEFLELHGTPGLAYRFTKRLMDLVLSIFAFVIVLPIFVIATLLIRFDSPGPTYITYDRVGFRGRHFRLFQFRTTQGIDSTGVASVTRAGRFLRATSLDELPQLINVIIGDMSIVGPRPAKPNKMTERNGSPYKAGSNMSILYYAKPGITGFPLATKSHKNAALAYVLNRSIWNDLLIFISSIKIRFWRDDL